MDNNQTPSLAQTLLTHPLKICSILNDLIQGGLSQINHKNIQYDSCKSENQDPILNGTSTCLAQCFHYAPDVNWVHLHSTAGVFHMRNGPIDSGLGLGYNVTEKQNAKAAYGKYNVCVCEPSSWGPRRGNCPTAQPYETGYVKEATKTLCQNVAGVAGIDVSHIRTSRLGSSIQDQDQIMFDVLFLCLLFGSCIGCNVPNFPSPSIVNAWRYNGAREKCFCGYSTFTDIDSLSNVCPSWYKYVSTDNQTANKVNQLGVATVLGSTVNNLTLSRYGQMTDWSVDFGSGYNNDCNKSLTPNCLPTGSHM